MRPDQSYVIDQIMGGVQAAPATEPCGTLTPIHQLHAAKPQYPSLSLPSFLLSHHDGKAPRQSSDLLPQAFIVTPEREAKRPLTAEYKNRDMCLCFEEQISRLDF